MKNIAPKIFRKRLLVEAKYKIGVDEKVILDFFSQISKELNLRIYDEPIVHIARGHKDRVLMRLRLWLIQESLFMSGLQTNFYPAYCLPAKIFHLQKHSNSLKNSLKRKDWNIKNFDMS